MTHDEVMALDEEELVLAVLKAQNYRYVVLPDGARGYVEPPRYFHDLNACFELLDACNPFWWRVYFCQEINPGYLCEIKKVAGIFVVEGYGDTLNIAILRAYLLARSDK
jgi:hypothetical protein